MEQDGQDLSEDELYRRSLQENQATDFVFEKNIMQQNSSINLLKYLNFRAKVQINIYELDLTVFSLAS